MAATMKEVAEQAGVSLITVSRVVNGVGYVRADTRARVLAAVAALEYIPNQGASSLRSRQTRTLALLLPTIANSFWTTIARGVEDEGEARGYSVFLCNTDDDPVKEARYLDVLLRRRVEGVVIVPTVASTGQLRRAQQRGMPVVQLHRKLDDLDADIVRSDSYGGAATLTEQLLATGRRRIAFIGGALAVSTARERLAGYEATLRTAGIAPDRALAKIGSATPESGYTLMGELLARKPHPEAVVIGNSRLALGALRALRDAGLAVPEDLAVAAFHDIVALDADSPNLITATQPAYDIGRLGTRRLLDRLVGLADPPVDLILPNHIKLPPVAGIDKPLRTTEVARNLA